MARLLPRPVRPMLAVYGLVMALGSVASVHAEPLPTDPVLAQLLQESLAVRPELAGAQAVIRAEHERVAQASALPDPMLQVGLQNDGFTSIEIGRMPTSYVSVMVSQTLPWPGKRGLRGEVAQLSSTQATQQLARLKLSIEADVRRGYLELLLVRERIVLLERLEGLWQRTAAMARISYETGTGTQSDLLRAQLELQRLRQRRAGLLGEQSNRVSALNRLRNRPLDEPLPTSQRLADLPAPAALSGQFSVPRALSQSPELELARLEVTRAGRQVRLAEKSYYPDLTFGAGIMIRGALPPMWLATVGGPLPVFSGSKQTRAVAEQQARASAAGSSIAAIEQLIGLRSEERRVAFAVLVESLGIYNEGLLVQSEATAESTLTQYRVGKVSFASVLEANAGLISDQEGFVQTIASAYRLAIAEAENSLSPTNVAAPASGSSAMPGAGAVSMEEGASASSAAPTAVPLEIQSAGSGM